MKKQETQSEPGSMSEELGDVLSRFKAWQATNGRKSESESTDVDTSWKLVYGQALDSINQLSSVELSAPAPAPVPGSPVAPSLAPRLVEDSVTDTISLSTRGPRPANVSEFLTPPSEPMVEGENSSTRIEEAPPTRSMKPAPAPPAPDVLYFRPAAFPAKPAAAAPAAPVQKPQVQKQVVQESEKPSANPRRQVPARPRATRTSEPATGKPGSRRRQELTPSAGNAIQKAALLKQKATEACITISAYLQQSENEVQRLRGKANDLRLDMDTVRCSVLSITQPLVAQQPAKSAMSKTPPATPPAQTVANVPTPANAPVPTSVRASESSHAVAIVPSFSTTLKKRLLRLIGVVAEE